MGKHKLSTLWPPQVCLGILLLSTATAAAWSQGAPDFSGLWKQDNDRCQPMRNGEVTLQIEHHDPTMTVETAMVRTSGSVRHANAALFNQRQHFHLHRRRWR
jgi:hypothetical protein